MHNSYKEVLFRVKQYKSTEESWGTLVLGMSEESVRLINQELSNKLAFELAEENIGVFRCKKSKFMALSECEERKAKRSMRRKQKMNPRKRGKNPKGAWSHVYRGCEYLWREEFRKKMREQDFYHQLFDLDFVEVEEEVPQVEVDDDFEDMFWDMEPEYPLDKEMLLKRLVEFKEKHYLHERDERLIKFFESYLCFQNFYASEKIYMNNTYVSLKLFQEDVIQDALVFMGFKLDWHPNWEDSYLELTFIG